ncbi:MAG: iron-sulfur cluster assembly protein [Anaerolineae bacterium]|nr:iron-sulfur cluster assembly protein [Candidatus Roseilinea sp.]MDW8449504.1 iron-sulfur cluster assembly protein [Anaerolineae bacterium]
MSDEAKTGVENKPATDVEPKVNLNEYSALEEKVRQALREVYDPELGMSVIELGLIRKLEFSPDSVNVTMILTTPFCPYGPALVEQVRQKTQEAAERVAKVTMGLEMWEPSMMEDQAAANWGLYY